MTPLNLDLHHGPYQALVGTGGIGSGRFFALRGDHTLGREESRAGQFLDHRDYCKLHIIAHYVKALTGPDFAVYPIGKVGADEPGRQLLVEMRQAGLEMGYVETCLEGPTLYSLCLLYPDGSGGNLTSADSVSERVDPLSIRAAEEVFARFAGHGIALAAPEVPLSARQVLLELGSKHHFFRAASFVSAEIPAAIAAGMLGHVDLLALNLEEAAAAAGLTERREPEAIAAAALEVLLAQNPRLRVSITAGKAGSWAWDGSQLTHAPVFPVEPVSTAGAGDAHLAGILAGLVGGLELAQAQLLGSLTAALSVTSPHTIHPGTDGETLRSFAARQSFAWPADLRRLLAI